MRKKRSKQRAAKPRAPTRLLTIRLPVALLAHFQSGGPGYQTRIRLALEEHVGRGAREAAFERTCAKLKHLSVKEKSVLDYLDRRPFRSERLRDPFGAISD
jgi:BrnA antitoxin of type II toxin-antitoxin system